MCAFDGTSPGSLVLGVLGLGQAEGNLLPGNYTARAAAARQAPQGVSGAEYGAFVRCVCVSACGLSPCRIFVHAAGNKGSCHWQPWGAISARFCAAKHMYSSLP